MKAAVEQATLLPVKLLTEQNTQTDRVEILKALSMLEGCIKSVNDMPSFLL